MRYILGLVGAVFSVVLLISFFSNVSTYWSSPPPKTAEEEFHLHPKHLSLASDGPLGKFDKQQLQRGFQVYKEVCSACHSLSQVAFHNLEGLGYTEAEIKAIANQWPTEVPSVNPETGEPATRKALPSDRFPAPYANDTAARAANNNALPPDLSLMTKARHGGAAYVYSLLTGYRNQPAELLKEFPAAKTPQGLHYNPYFANLNLAMPPPLTSEGQVVYAPGNPKPTVDQMAKDVAAFLVWTAEPNLPNRHATGIAVAVFLLFATVLARLAFLNIRNQKKATLVRETGVLEPENQAKSKRAKRKAGIDG
ncbi:cytochrome c1 [Sphingomonas daechungensis]|uniref:Cytochrome c1 n=1 Tax=Sphingomonas daechungensis TaxID=1176646 RepID=A0ABX6T3N8_9SPHN|nr:cytochrome c1 [Sphingomonas daechungensis]QNP43328.1 cytochrome c1 [Sphingomonas daechungensis]